MKSLNHLSKLITLVGLLVLFFSPKADAHPMPNSVVLLDVNAKSVSAELQLPLNELELAFGHNVNRNSDRLVERIGPELRAYILKHISVLSKDGKPWSVKLVDLLVQPVQESESGPYKELTVHLVLTPQVNESTREFTFKYDVIIHQVVSHFALVSVRNDWDRGLSAGHPVELGIIRLDVPSNTIPPLQVSMSAGSMWIGFKNMVSLGIDHIAEGTDHLLFLLVLLLPAPLLISAGAWKGFGGVKFSLTKILKIVTAFTIGHSITLLIGALGWLHFPGKPIEVLIAASILISAIHALKPIFPGKEIYIAAGFGLVHGMAFASTLVNLNLETSRLVLSILGFNIGIELMQLFVIAITIPWLIILAYNNFYSWIRITGSILAGIAAIAWMVERITDQPNLISHVVTAATAYSKWLVLLLAMLAVISYFTKNKKHNTNR